MWHGSIADEDEYVACVREAAPHFANFELPLAFFGHTHLQGGFFAKRNRASLLPRVPPQESETVIELEPDFSVYGQSRLSRPAAR